MSAFQIKLIAITAMIVDHIGLFFFPQFMWFRLVGRISFPLFAWLIANGAYHTRDIVAYLRRLYFFALLSQISFFAANRLIDPYFSGLNILSTLFFGLLAIVIIQKTQNKAFWLFITVLFAALAQVLQTDYGGFGVLVIVLFYVLFTDFKKLVLSLTLLFLAPLFLIPSYFGQLFEPVGLLSLLVIYFYNNKPGLSAKYLFYIIYPLQYVLFYYLLVALLKIAT